VKGFAGLLQPMTSQGLGVMVRNGTSQFSKIGLYTSPDIRLSTALNLVLKKDILQIETASTFGQRLSDTPRDIKGRMRLIRRE
jgi:hypothetical protein